MAEFKLPEKVRCNIDAALLTYDHDRVISIHVEDDYSVVFNVDGVDTGRVMRSNAPRLEEHLAATTAYLQNIGCQYDRYDLDNKLVESWRRPLQTLRGMSFSVTGKTAQTRDVIIAEIVAFGGVYHETPQQGDILVVGARPGSKKMKLIDELKLLTISESDLTGMMLGASARMQSEHDFPEQTYDQRMQIAKASVEELSEGIVNHCFKTYQDESGDWYLRMDCKLSEGPVAKFADLLFHGSENAHAINGGLFISGGLTLLHRASRQIRYRVLLSGDIPRDVFPVDHVRGIICAHPESDLMSFVKQLQTEGWDVSFSVVPKEYTED